MLTATSPEFQVLTKLAEAMVRTMHQDAYTYDPITCLRGEPHDVKAADFRKSLAPTEQ
jgi:hypothetical protein